MTITDARIPELADGEEWGVMPAVASPDQVDHARQVTHDQLIAQMGRARTGGVIWVTYDRAEGSTVAIAAGWPDIAAHLAAWPDTVLVVALAPGRPDKWDHQ